MGLDVYLYRYDDFAATQEREAQAQAFSETAWDFGGTKYDALSDEQKDAARAKTLAYNAEHGLGKYGEDETFKHKIELPSAKYPDHMFKIGYLRSSYNSGGINSVSRNLVGMELGDIFAGHDEYCFTPDWPLAKGACEEWIRRLRAAPKLRVSCISAMPLFERATSDEAKAISLAVVERGRKDSPFDGGAYSNRDGHYYPKGFKIVAAIPGVDCFNKPAVHLVFEDDESDWYVQAAEITLEMIEWVLAQPDRAKYRLHWSG